MAGDAGLAPGDVVQVLTTTGMHDATITGVATFGSADEAPLQRTVLLPDGAMSAWLDTAAPTEALVHVAEGADRAEALGRLSALTDAEVIDRPDYIRTMQNAATSPLQFLTAFLLIFAVVGASIGVTIIFNTFELTVAHRRRELGLLRAIGADRRHLLGGVVIEAALVGTIATLAGIVCGVAGVGALRWLVGLTGITLLTGPPIVSTTSIAVAATVGIGTTILSAWIPARRAAATPPIEALRESAAEPRAVSPARTVGGLGARRGGDRWRSCGCGALEPDVGRARRCHRPGARAVRPGDRDRRSAWERSAGPPRRRCVWLDRSGQPGREPPPIVVDGARAHARHHDGDDVRDLRELTDERDRGGRS